MRRTVRSCATLFSVKMLNTKRKDSRTTLVFDGHKFNEKSPAKAGLIILSEDEFKRGFCAQIH